MKTIHFFKSGKTKFYQLGEDGKIPADAPRHPCFDKRHAKEAAKEFNAKPWNF